MGFDKNVYKIHMNRVSLLLYLLSPFFKHRRTVTQSLTKAAKNPQIIFLIFYPFYAVFFPSHVGGPIKPFLTEFLQLYALKFRLFLGSSEFLALFKVYIDENPPKINLKNLWENAQILPQKCYLVGKIEFLASFVLCTKKRKSKEKSFLVTFWILSSFSLHFI